MPGTTRKGSFADQASRHRRGKQRQHEQNDDVVEAEIATKDADGEQIDADADMVGDTKHSDAEQETK